MKTIETLMKLKAILEKHKNERVCVIGTICCGKTTLLNDILLNRKNVYPCNICNY